MADEDFDVILLDSPEVKATAFYREGREGLAKSIEAVQKDLVELASTHVILARILTSRFPWRFFNVKNEGIHLRADKDYDLVKNGEHVYLIGVNCQTFSHYPDEMLAFVQGEGTVDGAQNVGLKENSFPLGAAYKQKLLGEHLAWVLKDGKIQEALVPFLTVDEYIKAQSDIKFLQQTPYYVSVFTEEQAAQYRHNDWFELGDQKVTGHVPSHMQSGTKAGWDDFLGVAKEKGYNKMYVGMPKLAEDSGRVGFVNLNDGGFFFGNAVNCGCSLGVSAGGALDALVNQYIALREPSQRLQRDIFKQS